MTESSFHIADYILFSLMLVVSTGIGVFFAIKDRNKVNTRDFLLAGGDMNAIPVAMSLLASFMSAITVLGTPAEMYQFGTMYWWIGLSYPIVVFFSAHVFVPVFYNMHLTSVFEYLEERFGKPARTSGAILFCIQMMLYMAIVVYAPSLALNAATGFTLWGSIAAITIVCTIYTTLGGMKAVLWTDTFQVGMMFAGMFAVLIQGSIKMGGFSNAWRIAEERGRVYFTDFSFDPSVRHSVWALVFGASFTWTAIYGANQAQVQRTLTTSTLKKAQIALWINMFGLILIMSVACLIGIVIFAFYADCDPLSLGRISKNDQLMPKFVMDVMGELPGLPGIFVACLFSAALSTVSSGLNSLSAVILHDVIIAYFMPKISEQKATNISKILVLVFGCICLGLSVVASFMGDVLQAALSLFGMLGGPVLGLFSLGMFFPWPNLKGALAGLYTSLVFIFWIGLGANIVKPEVERGKLPISVDWANCPGGKNFTNVSTTAAPTPEPYPTGDYYLYKLSYMYYSLVAVVVVLVVGLIVSFLTKPNKASDIDPRLISPLVDILFPWLPERFRVPLRFGVVHKDKHRRPSKRRISLGYDGFTPRPETEPENHDESLKQFPEAENKDGLNEGTESKVTNGATSVDDDDIVTKL